MSITITESKIKELHDNFLLLSGRAINLEVSSQLEKIREKHNYSKVRMLSGSGTWGFYVWEKGGVENPVYDHEIILGHFKELDEFLRFMAEKYKIWADDCEVDSW